jgi:hypothetical protein
VTSIPPPLSTLDRLWITETIRLREEHTGPLEDSEANRHANAAGGELGTRIQRRAMFLAQRDGQLQALQHWRQGAQLAMIPLLVLALITGAGLSWSALGDGSRPVNVFWAIGSLLGLNVLTLLGWLVGLLMVGDSGGALGRLWLWMSGKLARDAQAAQMAPALMHVLQRRRLMRWGLGTLVHGFWTLLLLTSLITVLLQFSARRYGFVWETTLLGSETFVALTQTLGWLPSLVGFPVPDIDTIRVSGDHMLADEYVRQAWAGWLIGVLLIYGLLPRILLGTLCLLRWRRGVTRMQLDLEQPGYQLLRDRLQPSSERLGVLDAAPDALPVSSAISAVEAGHGAMLVAIELDRDLSWPPRLPETVVDGGILDSREQRQHLLEKLSRTPPARLLIACDPRRSPDRGTLALIAELSRTAVSSRVWLLPAPVEALDDKRLQDWHQSLARIEVRYQDGSPLSWLETGHE